MKTIKRFMVALLGGTVLAVGVALVVLPGPAFLVIPAGLAILGIEFAWAKRWLRHGRAFVRRNNPVAGKDPVMRPLLTGQERE